MGKIDLSKENERVTETCVKIIEAYNLNQALNEADKKRVEEIMDIISKQEKETNGEPITV